MCIAIYKKPLAEINYDVLYRCWRKNSDGAGFMYPGNGCLRIQKGLFTWKDFIRCYQYALDGEGNGKPFVIHFRMSTSGKIDYENCHPFSVNKDLAFVHNGIILEFDSYRSRHSDSYRFNQRYLRTLPDGFLENPSFVAKLESWLGWSRLIFMDSSGKVTIINEGVGEWIDGSWYSSSGRSVQTPEDPSLFDFYSIDHQGRFE